MYVESDYFFSFLTRSFVDQRDFTSTSQRISRWHIGELEALDWYKAQVENINRFVAQMFPRLSADIVSADITTECNNTSQLTTTPLP